MEEIKLKDLVAGESYVGTSGDIHKIYARWYSDVNKVWEVMAERNFEDGTKIVQKWNELNVMAKFYKKPKGLAQKFQLFRSQRGSGSGAEYWNGLEKIAQDHFSEVINQSK